MHFTQWPSVMRFTQWPSVMRFARSLRSHFTNASHLWNDKDHLRWIILALRWFFIFNKVGFNSKNKNVYVKHEWSLQGEREAHDRRSCEWNERTKVMTEGHVSETNARSAWPKVMWVKRTHEVHDRRSCEWNERAKRMTEGHCVKRTHEVHDRRSLCYCVIVLLL